jgi:hypothetical protein
LSILQALIAMLVAAAALVWLPIAVVVWTTCRRVGRSTPRSAGEAINGG